MRGCGGLTTLRLMHKVLGGNVVVVNAAGCMTLLAVYPLTPLKSSWLYTTMGGAAAGAQGVRDALDLLPAKGDLPDRRGLESDGPGGRRFNVRHGTVIDFSGPPPWIGFLVLVLRQRGIWEHGVSDVRRVAVWFPDGNVAREVRSGPRRTSSRSGVRNEPPYLATVSSHEALDFAEKVRRAAAIKGPKLFLALAVCPTGWGFDPAIGDEIARLAIETGVWPLKESVGGEVRHTYIPHRFRPVEEYLKRQRRFQRLFSPHRRENELREIQNHVDRYWLAVRAALPGSGKERHTFLLASEGGQAHVAQ